MVPLCLLRTRGCVGWQITRIGTLMAHLKWRLLCSRQSLQFTSSVTAKTVPCVHSLLSSKRKACYCGVLRNINNFCEEHHIQLAPATVTVDFEVGLMAAISDEIPSTILHGRYIHFTQAIWRKLQSNSNNEVMTVC